MKKCPSMTYKCPTESQSPAQVREGGSASGKPTPIPIPPPPSATETHGLCTEQDVQWAEVGEGISWSCLGPGQPMSETAGGKQTQPGNKTTATASLCALFPGDSVPQNHLSQKQPFRLCAGPAGRPRILPVSPQGPSQSLLLQAATRTPRTQSFPWLHQSPVGNL